MLLIEGVIRRTTLNDSIGYLDLAVFPLTAPADGSPSYRTLDEALEEGTLAILEKGSHGSVPEVLVENRGKVAVLLLDGEELVGAKQNRVVNLTVLVPARSRIEVPVSCVEQGRWRDVSERFTSSPRTHYARGRARKMAAVSASLLSGAGRHADQGEVWEGIAAKAVHMAAEGGTGAMSTIYDLHAGGVEEYVRRIQPVAEQVGAVFAIGASILGVELFDHPDTLRKLLPKLVRSYAIDAIEERILREDCPAEDGEPTRRLRPTPETVEAFLDRVASAGGERFPAVGLGEDLRLSAKGLTGGALLVDDRVVHLAAFRNEERPRRAHGARSAGIAGWRRRRGTKG